MVIKMGNRPRKSALLLCTVLSASALWGCSQTVQEETVEDVAIVEASNPEIGDLKLSGSFIATINPDESVYVIPKATGEVLQVLVEAGDVVQEGDILAVLDDTIAQISMKNAEISANLAQISQQNNQLLLDNAQIGYQSSFGEGAELLNEMETDSNLSQVGDGVEALQEGLLDAMDSLDKTKGDLKDAENELADLKKEYDFREDVDEIKKYADTFDKNDPSEVADYMAAMERYQEAAAKTGPVEAKITQYKSAIDQCEAKIEEIQDQINSTYRQYSQAVTSSNIANGELREGQKQVSQNSVSQAELGISQAKLSAEQAKLSIEQAQENLDAYTIKATISGVVETVNVSEHDFASSGNPAFVIANKDTMVATYYVSEGVRNTFETGQQVVVEKDNKTYNAQVIEIGNAVDATTGLFMVKAAIKGDASALLSGTKATVTTDTYHEKNVVIIPYDSVYYDGTQAYVYTVVDGVARKTNITTGLYDIDKIVVLEGLTSNDVVVTTWSAQLREGVAVSVREPQANDKTQE